MGLEPGKLWGPVAGLSEFGGGVLTALGFLNPLGPIALAIALAGPGRFALDAALPMRLPASVVAAAAVAATAGVATGAAAPALLAGQRGSEEHAA